MVFGDKLDNAGHASDALSMEGFRCYIFPVWRWWHQSILSLHRSPNSLSLSLSLSVFMSKNCFGEMWKRAREVYLWLWGVAKQLAIDNGSKIINCFFFLFSFSFDNKFNWILGGKKERKKENGSDCYVCLISERKSKARGVLLKKLSFLEYTYIFMLPFSINFFCSFMHRLHHRSDHTFCPRWVSPPI